MDAKDRMKFMNQRSDAGAAGASWICANCHSEMTGKFCTRCGKPMGWTPEPEDEMANAQQSSAGAQRTSRSAGRSGYTGNGAQQSSEGAQGTQQQGGQNASAGSMAQRREAARQRPAQRPVQKPAQDSAEAENPGNPGAHRRGNEPSAPRRRVEPYVIPERRPALSNQRGTGIFRAAQKAAEDAELSTFAQGFPEWSLEPPQAPVRRKNRTAVM